MNSIASTNCVAQACTAMSTAQYCIEGNAKIFLCDPVAGFYSAPNLNVDATITSTASPDTADRFSYFGAWQNSTVSPTAPVQRTVIAGAIADPTVAPTLQLTTGGSMTVGTWRISYAWVGRYSSTTVSSGLLGSSMKQLAVTDLSPEAVIATDPTNKTIIVTIPGPYPPNAYAFVVFCNLDGDANADPLKCPASPSFHSYPSLSVTLTNFFATTSGTPTANNTVDREAWSLKADGWLRWDPFLSVHTHANFAFRPWRPGLNAVSADKDYLFGPDFAFSNDGGTTFAGALRVPQYDIAAGSGQFGGQIGGPTLTTLLPYFDGVRGPLTDGGSNRATIHPRGPSAQETVTWRSGLSMIGDQQIQPETSISGVTIDLTNVTDAAFSGLVKVSFTGSGCKRIVIRDSNIYSLNLTNCEDVSIENVTLSAPTTVTNDHCGTLTLNGGSYTIRNSDLTCYQDPSDPFDPLIDVGVPITIGQASGGGIVSNQSEVTIANNTWGPRESTDAPPRGFLRAHYDATATASLLNIVGNTVVMDNSAATACDDPAPGNGGLIAINSGIDSTAGLGRVIVNSVGNVLRFKGCEKGNIYRLADLDDDFSTFHSLGDHMYGDTSAVGSGGLDDDTHCVEWVLGMPGTSIVEGGSCVLKNDATGFNRPFYVHSGCCASSENPQVHIRNEFISVSSTDASVGGAESHFGIGNGADMNNGADIWVDGVTMRQAVADSGYVDFYIAEAAISHGSTISIVDSDYSTADIADGDGAGVGGIRVQRSRLPQATAPSVCVAGDTYLDTFPTLCLCTAANTWTDLRTNTSPGNCL